MVESSIVTRQRERITELRAQRELKRTEYQTLVQERQSLEAERGTTEDPDRLRGISKRIRALRGKISSKKRVLKQFDTKIDRAKNIVDVEGRQRAAEEKILAEEEQAELNRRIEFYRGVQEERRAARSGDVRVSEKFEELAKRKGVITPEGKIIEEPLTAQQQRGRMFGVPKEPLAPKKTRAEQAQTQTYRLTTIPKRITPEGLQERETAFFPADFVEEQKRVRRGQMALDTQYEIIARNAQGDVPFAKERPVLSGYIDTKSEEFREQGSSLSTLRAERELAVERAQAARGEGRTGEFFAAGLASAGQTALLVPSSVGDFAVRSTKGLREDINNPDVRISGAVRKRIIGVGETAVEFAKKPSVGLIGLGAAGFSLAKKTYEGTAEKFSERPFQVVTEAVAFDVAGRGVLRVAQSTKFIGKKSVSMSETVDPQSYFGASEDVLQEVRYPVSQADVVTTRRTQAQGSERIIEQITAPSRDRLIRERIRQDKIREASGFGSRVFDFQKATVEKGLLYQASPEPIPTTLVNGRQRITVLSKEELELITGQKQASDAGGLFASDKTSTAFLGLGGESRTVEISLVPRINNPSIQRIQGSAGRLPKEYRRLTAKEAEELFQRPDLLPEDYDFYVTAQREIALKTEKEVKAPAGTILEQTKEYTATQRALGRDFDKFTVVPSRIPTDNLQTASRVLDPDTGKIITVEVNTIGIPTTSFRLVPIREFKVTGRATPSAIASTSSATDETIARVYSRSPSVTVSRSPTGFFSRSSSRTSNNNFRSSTPFFSRSSSLASSSLSSSASSISSRSSTSSASRSLTSRSTSITSRSISSGTRSSGGSSYGGGRSSISTIITPEKPIELDKPTKKTKKELKKKKRKKYLPSLTGIDKGIKATKKSAEGFTGLELRGI